MKQKKNKYMPQMLDTTYQRFKGVTERIITFKGTPLQQNGTGWFRLHQLTKSGFYWIEQELDAGDYLEYEQVESSWYERLERLRLNDVEAIALYMGARLNDVKQAGEEDV